MEPLFSVQPVLTLQLLDLIDMQLLSNISKQYSVNR